jgi:hypothetical protein
MCELRRSSTAGLTAERAPRDDTNRHELLRTASVETGGNALTDTPDTRRHEDPVVKAGSSVNLRTRAGTSSP